MLLLESSVVKVICTPVAFVGLGCCSYRYSIHWVMYWSAIAGVPAAGIPRLVCPGDWSVTEPFMRTWVFRVDVSGVAAIVVAHCPWANVEIWLSYAFGTIRVPSANAVDGLLESEKSRMFQSSSPVVAFRQYRRAPWNSGGLYW